MSRSAVVSAMARAIHEARCTSRSVHASDEALEHCVRFYEDHAEAALDALTTEERPRWQPVEEPPEGWRSGAQWVQDNGDMVRLWTDAPAGESPFNHNVRWIRSRRIRQRRWVSAWEDLER